MRMPAKTNHCQLCERVMIGLTKHHLIPRTRHRKKRSLRQFDLTDMRTRIIWVCRPCHNHIHDVLSEKELAENYNTRQALLEHDDIRRFVDWVKTKPTGFKPSSRVMK